MPPGVSDNRLLGEEGGNEAEPGRDGERGESEEETSIEAGNGTRDVRVGFGVEVDG